MQEHGCLPRRQKYTYTKKKGSRFFGFRKARQRGNGKEAAASRAEPNLTETRGGSSWASHFPYRNIEHPICTESSERGRARFCARCVLRWRVCVCRRRRFKPIGTNAKETLYPCCPRGGGIGFAFSFAVDLRNAWKDLPGDERYGITKCGKQNGLRGSCSAASRAHWVCIGEFSVQISQERCARLFSG